MAAAELTSLEGHIAGVTLNRSERLTAIDGALIDGMNHALDALGGGEFRAVILTGAGRGFCAGADLSGTVDRGQSGQNRRHCRRRRSRPAMTPRFAWPIFSPNSASCRSR